MLKNSKTIINNKKTTKIKKEVLNDSLNEKGL